MSTFPYSLEKTATVPFGAERVCRSTYSVLIRDRKFYLVIVLNAIPFLSIEFETFLHNFIACSTSCPRLLPEFFFFNSFVRTLYIKETNPFTVKLQNTYPQFAGERRGECEDTGVGQHEQAPPRPAGTRGAHRL